MLGQRVARGGLGAEDADARRELSVRLVQDAAVQVQDVQQVEVLALVLVQSLDLHVKERVRRDVDVDELLDAGGEADLVGALDRQEAFLEGRTIGDGVELAQAAEVGLPAGACELVTEGAELRIAAAHPATGRDAVGHVDELALPELVKAREQMGAQEAGVEFGHAVDMMRADDREVRHADAFREAFLDDRELGLAGVVSRPATVDLLEVAAVDLVDDLEVAREHLLEERHGPGLERLRQQGVVRVAEGLRAERPGFIPSQALDVDQQAHQFGDRDRRVRIVELDGGLGRQGTEIRIQTAMAA